MSLSPTSLPAFWIALAVTSFLSGPRLAAADDAGDSFSDPPATLTRAADPEGLSREKELAAALFTAGRLRAQKKDLNGALRLFQQAHRADPDSSAILAEIVPIAFELNRHAEAARYAILAAESRPTDAVLLGKLATLLAAEHDYARAARLYEHAARLSPWKEDKPDGRIVKLHFELGRLRYLLGDAARAAESFSLVHRALAEPAKFDLSPENVRDDFGGNSGVTHLLLADCFLAAGKLDEAEAEYKTAHRDDADSPLAEFHLAQIAVARKDSAAALARLEKYFAAKSTAAGDEAYPLLERALLISAADPAAAAQAYGAKLRELRSADAKNPHVATALARHERAAGKLAAAAEQLAAAMELESTSAGRQELAELYRELKREGALLSLLAKIARESGSLDGLGKQYRAIAADGALVAKLMQMVHWPREPQAATPATERGALFAVGLVALRAGKFDDARGLLLEAAQTGQPPRSEILLAWAEELTESGQLTRAIEPLRLALEEPALAGKRAAIHDALARALTADKQFDEALRQADRAAALETDSPKHALRRAWVLRAAGRLAESDRAYRTFVIRHEEDYGSAEVRDAVRSARRALASLAVERGKPSEAEGWLEQILDEFPEDAASLNDLGYLWAERRARLGRALTFTRLAVAAESENASFRDSLGWVYYRLGRMPEAVIELEKAARGERTSGVVWEHLGDARAAAGKSDAAREAWLKAEQAYERDGAADRAKAARQKRKAM